MRFALALLCVVILSASASAGPIRNWFRNRERLVDRFADRLSDRMGDRIGDRIGDRLADRFGKLLPRAGALFEGRSGGGGAVAKPLLGSACPTCPVPMKK